MSVDLNELKELVAAIKADHQAQKEKEKRDSWTKYVSLSMICLAVLAAIANQKGGSYSSVTLKSLNEATFNQANASDQWSYYQAKSIKQSLYELEIERLNNSGVTVPAKTTDAINGRIKRYDGEKQDITDKAKGFEAKRNEARVTAAKSADRGSAMGLSITVFQIAIALGGMCLVVKKKWLWWVSLGAGALATLQMLRVFYLM
ncbi:MAG TPA: DUF4337 domain-containing protein [Opitutaceae bacterium]|nr:DUF4337 domain-containing protein [Opitutaceae bacterium]